MPTTTSSIFATARPARRPTRTSRPPPSIVAYNSIAAAPTIATNVVPLAPTVLYRDLERRHSPPRAPRSPPYPPRNQVNRSYRSSFVENARLRGSVPPPLPKGREATRRISARVAAAQEAHAAFHPHSPGGRGPTSDARQPQTQRTSSAAIDSAEKHSGPRDTSRSAAGQFDRKLFAHRRSRCEHPHPARQPHHRYICNSGLDDELKPRAKIRHDESRLRDITFSVQHPSRR